MKNRLIVLMFLSLLVSTPSWSADEKHPPGPAVVPGPHVKRVGVEEFDKLRSEKTNVVLDVRTPEEFKAGHIPGAVNINFNSPDFDKQIGALDKNKTYLVHCAAGGRSAKACKKLDNVGFKELYDLAPGFKGWEKAGKPVEK